MVVHDLNQIAFPTLDATRIAELSRCTGASLERHEDGETLIEVGDRDFQFHVVTKGAIEILDVSGDAPRSITVHGPGQFTGDVSHLTGNPSVIRAITRGPTEAYAVSSQALREMLSRCPVLADIVLQAFIARRQLLRESESFVGLRVIGSRYSHDTFRIRDFLAKNRVLFTWLDLELDPEVARLLAEFGVREDETPVVACAHRVLLRNPTNLELAEGIGLRTRVEQKLFDLAIVGAGPAGLAAAVYGASEGLSTILLDRLAAGGQAGTSMRIENYLGFPTGITGAELADRAALQANRFGAHLSIPSAVASLSFDGRYPVVTLENGETVVAKALLIATGAQYRRLEVEECERFEGSGVYYAATPNEAKMCHGADVVVVGGGNSAGQAAVFLSGQARKVYHLIRGDDLNKDMSSYLVRRVEQTGNIELLRGTEVKRMHGDNHIAAVDVRNRRTGEETRLEIAALFSFIGAVPRTEWLPKEIETDARGFVLTGSAVKSASKGPTTRDPFLLETSRRGVFAAGDVRAGSVKRVASAVGEGSMVIQLVHEYLKET
ncbi:MAG TPA: FAD-dependent oxidoreductase [Planctomycetota bacterium]|jgi:thioredoxin reductase (NADPH)|nr:FAD-dependent oxidoreductase [Planctomycetota bacterium]